MKKIKLTIVSIGLILVGYILGTIFQPVYMGRLMREPTFERSGDPIPRISVDKIGMVQDRINEEGLEWTHAYPVGNSILVLTYGFQPWSAKRVDEKLEIALDILHEFENNNNSNQHMDFTVKTPVD